MSEHDNLRELLQKIAATVGDPPEHGLERVVARRRRRTRHRRGAVAAAVALAVGGFVAVPWLSAHGGDRADLTAADAIGVRPERSKMPDVVELVCNPSGIDVPVAHIQTQRDGMHLVVHNGHAGTTQVWVASLDGSGWSSGQFEVAPGNTDVRQPAPPGVFNIGCLIAGEPKERRVDLFDVDHHYKEPELSCPTDQQTPLPLATFPRSTTSAPEAGLFAMGDYWNDDEYAIAAVSGYDDEFYGYHTTKPWVQVRDRDETVAFVFLTDGSLDDGMSASGPWVGADHVDACKSVLEDAGNTPGTTATTLASTLPE